MFERLRTFLPCSQLVFTLFTLSLLIPTLCWSVEVRIKDLVNVVGVRGNDLVGYGLVVGLNGTGDGLRNSPFTEEAMANLLERLGINITGEQFRPKNVAAVLVTATLPPFARNGSQIDVTVSAIGDSKSLLGGTLIMTPLNAADGQIYAVAQGAVISGGSAIEGDAALSIEGVPTSGSIPSGARIEREIAHSLKQDGEVTLALREPDFTTSLRIESAINDFLRTDSAKMLDSGTVLLAFDKDRFDSVAHMLSSVENVLVSPARRARVVVDHRSGTIVLGSDVRVSSVAVAQGNLKLKVRELPVVVANNPFFPDSNPLEVPRTEIEMEQGDETNGFALLQDSVSLAEIVVGLNALGVGPRDTIHILKAIKAAGALHAEFIIQ